MFGFFGSGKKQDSPAPQPQNTPQQPQRIIEKGIIEKGTLYSKENAGALHRGRYICDSFGTTDLDLVLERYAPEQMDKIQTIFDNQFALGSDHHKIYNKLQEMEKQLKAQDEQIAALQEQLKLQNEWNERLLGKLDFISGVLGEMYEAAFKKQMGKEPENKIPQK